MTTYSWKYAMLLSDKGDTMTPIKKDNLVRSPARNPKVPAASLIAG